MIKKCGIIYNDKSKNLFLLVFGKKSFKWGFPKGHMENNESEEETAIREFYEETGIKVFKEQLLEKIRFKNNVYFYVTHDNINPQHVIIHDTNEILKTEWFSMEQILNLPRDTINYGLKSWLNHSFSVNNASFRFPKYVLPKESKFFIRQKTENNI